MQDSVKAIVEHVDNFRFVTLAVALFVGFCSILLAYLTLRMNRKHHRLTVRPIADFTARDFEDELSVVLENKGNGPLVIKQFRASVGDESKSNIIDWMPDLPTDMFWSDFHKNFENTSLRPGQSLTLIALAIDLRKRKQHKVRDDVRRALSKIDVEMVYLDLYDTEFHHPKKSLAWFERNLQ